MIKHCSTVLLSFALTTPILSSQPIAASDVSLEHEVTSLNSGETGILFAPMKGLLRSFPLGFSFCADSITRDTTYAIQNVFGFSARIEGRCLVFNNVTLRSDAALVVTTASASFDINLRALPTLSYADQSFRALRSDSEIYATMTYDNRSVGAAEEAVICANRPVNKVSFRTRPLGSNEDYQVVPTSVANRFCAYVYSFPWDSGVWGKPG